MEKGGDWWEPAPDALVQAKPAALARGEGAIREIEDEIHTESASVLRSALAFGELDPAMEEPPPAWVEAYGGEEAWKRFRLAKYAMLSAKEAPVGLKLAKDTFVGMAAARAKEKGGTRTLNMTFVQMSRPMPEYPKKDVEK